MVIIKVNNMDVIIAYKCDGFLLEGFPYSVLPPSPGARFGFCPSTDSNNSSSFDYLNV